MDRRRRCRNFLRHRWNNGIFPDRNFRFRRQPSHPRDRTHSRSHSTSKWRSPIMIAANALKVRSVKRRNERGLTLLEVLAAVMIFAMVMTVLISTSTNAVHHVGQSARRLDADLVADTLLSDLEIQIRQGLAPGVEDGEFTQDQYTIRLAMTDLIPSDSISGSGAASGAASEVFAGDALSSIGGALPEVAAYLRQYDIEVSWLTQSGPQSVLRTTFAYDWPAAQIELASLIETASSASAFGQGGLEGSGPGSGPGNGGGTGASGARSRGASGSAPPTPFEKCGGRNAGDCQRRNLQAPQKR
ncbi:MAG TPA: prepilin-type N-terminal cleavage/methylation domain-containing protein [Myxococcales bacterium]|nr:prepilin-type N-terminal cleavage/methylation domain-containing protein [Myxococcales bacterium]